MMNIIKNNTERLGKDIQTTGECLNKMKKAMGDMQGAVSEIYSMWEGEGKQAFHHNWETDMKKLNGILTTLASINKYEAKAGREYVKCENKVSGIIERLKV